MIVRLATWWIIFRVAVGERLVYRADFFLATFMRFLPIVTQVFLWKAVFSAMTDDDIAGYAYHDFIAYYLLTMVGRAFSSMPNLSAGIAQQVRDGEIKKFLVQPIDLVSFLLLQRIAHKLVYYVMAAIPFAVVFYICRGYFSGWPPPGQFMAYFAALMIAFLLGFFLELCIGLVAFWWLEVTSMLFVYMLLNFFLSGHMFPLDLLPDGIEAVIRALPLHYMAYFPTAVFLGKIEGAALTEGLWVGAAWIAFFIGLSRVLLLRGYNRYSGFGG